MTIEAICDLCGGPVTAADACGETPVLTRRFQFGPPGRLGMVLTVAVHATMLAVPDLHACAECRAVAAAGVVRLVAAELIPVPLP